MENMHTDFQVLRVENKKQTNKQQQNNKDSVTQPSRVNLMQHCCRTKMFNTWIVILASVQSLPKKKKETSAFDFFDSTSVERESRKTFAKRANR